MRNKLIGKKLRKSKLMREKLFNIFYVLFSAWWIAAIEIAILQMYFMLPNFIFLIALVIMLPILIFGFYLFYKKIKKGSNWIGWVICFLVVIHFLPLASQILGFRNPGMDSIVSALIGFMFLWFRLDF